MKLLYIFLSVILLITCKPQETVTRTKQVAAPFTWDNASIYFLMTDRFYNGDESNDFVHPEDAPPAPYRGYMGGDVKGITQKIEEGYFDSLGINAIWMTPLVEQIQGSVDEGTGVSYPFHGYWTRDWTAIDKRIGTKAEVKEMVQTAHKHNIRIIMDAVANHTGPVTKESPVWPSDWVRTGPKCKYTGAETTIACTLVENLPDILTESDKEVTLPEFLIEKWKKEGRYEEEVAELDVFFEQTGYKRTPVNYIIKWLVDLIKDFGIDGFRVDTVKHTEGYVWADLYKAALEAYELMKKEHPEMVIADNEFYMVGEVYNYYINNGRLYDYNDKIVDFYNDGFHALINFDLKESAHISYEDLFFRYDSILHTQLKGKSVVNYISSHDDGNPYDKMRNNPIEAMTRLMLTPGAVQLYYGDESARRLDAKAEGDATLRSFMNWDMHSLVVKLKGYRTMDVISHSQKLGRFRSAHPSIGAGKHKMISKSPYLFSRTYNEGNIKDKVVVGLELPSEATYIDVTNIFEDGSIVKDAYSGTSTVVNEGTVTFTPTGGLLLLEQK